jgi:hypothetical protein
MQLQMFPFSTPPIQNVLARSKLMQMSEESFTVEQIQISRFWTLCQPVNAPNGPLKKVIIDD